MHLQSPGSGLDEHPVIPDINLYGHDSEDDVVSSAISSVDTLTTPPPNHTHRSRVTSVYTSPATAPRYNHNASSSSSGHQTPHNRSEHKNGPLSGSKQSVQNGHP